MVIIFDGVCNLCNGAVNFIIDRDKKNIFKFASLQSAFGQNLLKGKNMNSTDFNTIVLLKNNKIYTKSTAIFEIFKEFGFPYSMLSIFNIFPLFLTN
ncbi:MAG TPA: thiol-disulfide oxidoreductase, partial [Flavobacterium sp.]|nr:thiol-disulfide oxidoreductase [Flavobacterium sp.]